MKKIIYVVLGFGLVMMLGGAKASSGITNLFGSQGRADPKVQEVINTQLQGATEGDARFCGDLYYINRDNGPEAAKAQSFAAAKLWAKPSSPEYDNYKLYNYPNIEKWFKIKNGKPQDPANDKPLDMAAMVLLIGTVAGPATGTNVLSGKGIFTKI